MKTWLLTLLLLTSCGHKNIQRSDYHFFVGVVNQDSLTCRAKVSAWFGSQVTMIYEWDIQPGQEFDFDLGKYKPDGFEIETSAWKITYGPSDYAGCDVFVQYYPIPVFVKRVY